jgi:hypothetical protein
VYFGDLLPNTFYAKMGPAPGRDYDGVGYVWSLVQRRPLLVLGPVALLGITRRPAAVLPVVLAAAAVGFAWIAGGDWMMNRRLLVPALPLLALGAAAALTHGMTESKGRTVAVASILGLLAIEGGLSTARALDQTWRRREHVDERLASWIPAVPLRAPFMMDWMPTYLMWQVAPYVRPGEQDVVAHVDVGQLPYVMHDVRFLDGFGLVDREAGRVAYRPHDSKRRQAARDAFFRARPAAVIAVLDHDSREPLAPGQAAFLGDPQFDAEYIKLGEVPTWGDHACVTFVRRDIAAASAEEKARRVEAWLARTPDLRPAF